jgi:hypothetical protein
MRTVILRSAILVLGLAGATAAMAQASRYSMTPVEGGALRLDTQSGEVSYCMPQYGTWKCSGVADEMAKLRTKIGDLKKENRALKSDVKRLERVAKAAPKADATPPKTDKTKPEAGEAPPAAPPVAGNDKIPGDDEIDQMMTFLEKMARRLKGMVEELRREQQAPQTKQL